MSTLPKYRLHDEENDLESNHEDSRPLLEGKAHEDQVAPPTYPPRQGGPSSYPGTSTTYHYVPRWPMKGETENALGVAGSKEYTTRMVQNAFPALAALPPSRIEFLAPATPEAKLNEKANWSKIMDEAWSAFETNPPARLLVQVADLPGQFEARQRRQNCQVCMIMFAIIGGPFLLFGIIGIVASIFG